MIRLNVSYTRKMISEIELEAILNIVKSDKIKEAILLSYKQGLKIKDVLKKIDIPRRTLQQKLNIIGKRAIGTPISFEQLRQSCMINLFSKGYNLEYIRDFMGYTKNSDIPFYRRKIAGYIKPSLRFKILARDNFNCVFCGNKKNLVIDHIIPVSKGGHSIENNLQTLCEECNIGKGNIL